jgi:hypothetical protein
MEMMTHREVSELNNPRNERQTMSTVIGSTAVVMLLATLILATIGCTSSKQIRSSYTGPQNESSVIESTDDYRLGFVEFDDQGWFWDHNQLDSVSKTISEEAGLNTGAPHGLIIVSFVHGWKHNADTNDDNVKMMREVLAELNQSEKIEAQQKGREPRHIVGVYGGWRGLSATLEPFKEMSFWDRKNTAQQVGHGALTEMLVTLETLQAKCNEPHRASLPRTELILVGHSFGGAAVYSALSQIVAERYVDTIEQGHPLKPLGDMIILLNPAFEAARHYNLNELAVTTKKYPEDQRPVLAIFTSKGDWATHYAFPIGRFFSNLFESYRSDLPQSAANRDAVGWFDPFRTHNLVYDADAKMATSDHTTLNPQTKKHERGIRVDRARLQRSMENLRDQRSKWHPNAQKPVEYSFDDCVLEPEPTFRPGDPIFVVSVDARIMKDHDDIANPAMINFLREFIIFCQPSATTTPQRGAPAAPIPSAGAVEKALTPASPR